MIEPLTDSIRLLRADNPGPMTLTGTDSYFVGPSGAEGLIVVDPGPDLDAHVSDLVDAGPIALVLVTHFHEDHTGASRALHAVTGAPVRAFDAEFCIDAEPLTAGEVIVHGSARIRVLSTPGHTRDSVSFLVEDGVSRAVLTGDTILGEGTTVLGDYPDALADYLDSLRALRELGEIAAFPGHGPMLPSIAEVADEYLRHRLARLDQVRAAVTLHGAAAPAEVIVREVYGELAPGLEGPALQSVTAQLSYLTGSASA